MKGLLKSSAVHLLFRRLRWRTALRQEVKTGRGSGVILHLKERGVRSSSPKICCEDQEKEYPARCLADNEGSESVCSQ